MHKTDEETLAEQQVAVARERMRRAEERIAFVRTRVRPGVPERPEGSVLDDVSRAIVGVILDMPELRHDADVQYAIALLTGDAAAIIGELDHDDSASTSVAYRVWAVARLDAPVHQHADTAKREAMANAEKLQRRVLSKEKAAAEEASAAAEARGDEDESLSLLAEAMDAARKKHEMRRGKR